MASSWLSGASGSSEGIRFPGVPSRRTATLILGRNGAGLLADESSVELPWAEAEHSWQLVPWSYSDSTPAGLGVQAFDAVASTVSPIVASGAGRTEKKSLTNRTEAVLALYRARIELPQNTRERATLRMMCRVLRDRPETREALQDGDRTERLITDLRSHARSEVPDRLHLKSDRVDIRSAMYVLGLVHPYGGRPLGFDVSLWTLPAAIEAVLAHVAANPYASNRPLRPQDASAVLEREYFAVEPWPFSALAD